MTPTISDHGTRQGGWPPVFLGVLFALSAVKYAVMPVNPDNAVHLKAARVILEQGNLYHHFFETNPPLFPWATVLPVSLAHLVGGSEVFFYNGFVYALAGLVLVLTGMDLKRAGLLKTSSDTILILGSWIVILVGLQGLDLGQRDHVVGLLIFPYLVDLALRSHGSGQKTGQKTGRAARLHVALLLAAALAIKPQFLGVWVLGEAWIAVRSGSLRGIANKSNALIVVSGLAYLALVYRLEPAFYTDILPLVHQTYGASTKQVSGRVMTLWAALTLLQVLAWRLQAGAGDSAGRDFRRALSAAFFIGSQAGFLGYLLQAHYAYHLWPFIMASCAALPLAVSARAPARAPTGAGGRAEQRAHWLRIRARTGARTSARIKGSATAAVLVIILVMAAPAWTWRAAVSRYSDTAAPAAHPWAHTYGDLANLVAVIDRFAGDKTWTALSSHVHITFPADYYTAARWSMRYHVLWPLPGLAGQTGGEYTRLKDTVRAQVAQDLATHRPALILLDVSEEKRFFPRDANGKRSFDYLKFFNRSAAFRDAFSAYASCGTFAYQQHALRIYVDTAQVSPGKDICNP